MLQSLQDVKTGIQKSRSASFGSSNCLPQNDHLKYSFGEDTGIGADRLMQYHYSPPFGPLVPRNQAVFLNRRNRFKWWGFDSCSEAGFVKRLIKALLPLADLCMVPMILPAAIVMRALRRAGVDRMPMCRRVLSATGVFPIANQYYEPLIDFRLLNHPLDQHRYLPGIDLNIEGQLAFLRTFIYSEELRPFLAPKQNDLTYSFGNTFFTSGDAEFLYNLVRLKKPKRVVEIGSGNSTLLVIEAIRKNQSELTGYRCEHICIEPYEMPWLEQSGVIVKRERVESVDKSLFTQLEADDLLFIDSSHVIRPQGDVVCEFLEILPALKKGVVVHIHDIFTPRDYPVAWVVDKVRFWNEQYLMEALLSGNSDWKIIGALNFLKHDHYDQLKAVCPFLTSDHEPASFYLEKIA